MGDKKKGKKNRNQDSKQTPPAKDKDSKNKDRQSVVTEQDTSQMAGSSSFNSKTLIRHYKAPRLSGCRWCGYGANAHGFIWVQSVGNHVYVPPTPEQIKARARAGASAYP